MKTFQDVYGNTVHLSFSQNAFGMDAKHVLVICRYKNQWLFTRHKKRGLEFPGGKVELGETPEAAAIREVKEETGAIIDSLRYIGQYEVIGSNEHFVKNVYFAKITSIEKHDQYFETNGPVLSSTTLTPESLTDEYSFIMKDEVIQSCIAFIKDNHFLLENTDFPEKTF